MLLLAGGAAVYAATQATVPKHEVPGVVGMTAEQALAQVGEFGWKIDRQDQVRRRDAPPARSSVRIPRPGSKLKEGAHLLAGRVARPDARARSPTSPG